ncbi:hypothetical protein [Phenylobacterium sp.]|uniref:hypothetical protein n=1 Tax=Phenylobacterium sp. TaxID=1871053 RepID=UPI003565002F
MRRNPQLLARRPLDGLGGLTWIASGVPIAATLAVVVAVMGGGLVADRYDATRRAADVRATLAARGLGPAQVWRVWRRVDGCRQPYAWRSAAASGAACADGFSPSVEVYAPGRRAGRSL